MDDRFKVVYYQQPKALEDTFKVIVDTKTGVNYLQLLLVNSSGTSITPLFDSNGKVVVSTPEEIANLEEVNSL